LISIIGKVDANHKNPYLFALIAGISYKDLQDIEEMIILAKRNDLEPKVLIENFNNKYPISTGNFYYKESTVDTQPSGASPGG